LTHFGRPVNEIACCNCDTLSDEEEANEGDYIGIELFERVRIFLRSGIETLSMCEFELGMSNI